MPTRSVPFDLQSEASWIGVAVEPFCAELPTHSAEQRQFRIVHRKRTARSHLQ